MAGSNIVTPLASPFYERPALEVAPDLIGKLLVHDQEDAEALVGRIVETEAYMQDDPACHAWHLIDRETGEIRSDGRGHELFGPPGLAYVYLCYGMYWLFNVVTGPEGVCGAVLVRAVEPLQGIGDMQARRSAAKRVVDLTNGPGKLAQALDIDERHHQVDVTRPPLYIAASEEERNWPIASSCRIGISKGTDLPWRFFIEGNRFVSRPAA